MAAAPSGVAYDKVGKLTKLGAKVKNWKERYFGLSKSGKIIHYYETEAALRKHEQTDEKNFLGAVDLKDGASIVCAPHPLHHSSSRAL